MSDRTLEESAAASRPLRIAILGATGRMGHCLLRAVEAAADLELVGAATAPGTPGIGDDAGRAAGLARRFDVALCDDPARAVARAEVAIDFTRPDATGAHARACVERGCALVVGTTGLDAAAHAALDAAAARIPVLQAANTSLGVNLLARLVRTAAAALPPEYDIEIVEAHHRHKVDAPSGTALRLGEAAAEGRGGTLESLAVDERKLRREARPTGSIGFAVVRGGDIVGDHRVLYAAAGEVLELAHRATDRMTFATGALGAARWLRGRAAGRYTMDDVLGL